MVVEMVVFYGGANGLNGIYKNVLLDCMVDTRMCTPFLSLARSLVHSLSRQNCYES